MDRKFVIIFGYGAFGQRAYTILRENYRCLVIDIEFPPRYKEQDEFLFFPQINQIFWRTIELLNPKTDIFLRGSAAELIQCLNRITPVWIIATAPIHLMDSVVQILAEDYLPHIRLTEAKTPTLGGEVPPFRAHHGSSIYLSYAAPNETCPDNCLGPKKFCPIFEREKQLPLSEWIEKNNPSDIKLFLFKSIQIAPGLGGIRGRHYFETIRKFHQFLDSEKESLESKGITDKTICIATACNCHGVLDFHSLKRTKLIRKTE